MGSGGVRAHGFAADAGGPEGVLMVDPQMQVESRRMLSRRRILGLGAATGTAVALAAWGSVTTAAASPAVTSGTQTAAGTARPAATGGMSPAGGAGETWLYLSIVTGKMIGKKGYPEFVPADFSIPANATVHAEIRCFDDGAATIPSGYEKVKGTVDGAMTVLSAVNGDVSTAKSQTVQAVDPKNVAHTLTIADTGLNIPIPPLSTVRFTFKSGGSGIHGWQCMAACGTGQGGWGGPMATNGYMSGTMAVV